MPPLPKEPPSTPNSEAAPWNAKRNPTTIRNNAVTTEDVSDMRLASFAGMLGDPTVQLPTMKVRCRISSTVYVVVRLRNHCDL